MKYKQAGVDVEKGDELVEWLKSREMTSASPYGQVLDGIGGFAALYRLNLKNLKSPCLVTSTDGVGTKLKIGIDYNQVRGLGQDLVAMCVNDLLTVGATPLFFLDYYATSKLDLDQAKSFLQGLREACALAECPLIGGETAEMPGFYKDGDFDCAGFVVGIVDEDERLGPHRVKSGDRLIGVSSSGFHSNGYSLLRKVFEKDMREWSEQLLTPTHIYTSLTNALKKQTGIRAMAHITGGGMENLPRVLPQGYGVQLKKWKWSVLFEEVKTRAKLSNIEMLKTFNCGVGWVIVVSEEGFSATQEIVKSQGLEAFDLGTVEQGREGIDYGTHWN